ncbi:hypothetical protein CPB84DRAFT_1779252 [Gymnopilus junonius]|uniref:Uncharacterized protein n=1 Tax=Gymnopilus junonius TaxID=109634 RepID=A0A9P5TLY9_GYMJU|nr:hypothetical protein CPB84DRAFT_1779252 [Gymnopilus junonius]
MASISEIPVEILSVIFKDAYKAPEPLTSDDGPLTSLWRAVPDIATPMKGDRVILSTYPFNIMRVCQLWQSVFCSLKTPDYYWTRLIFDVDNDEIDELLDTFSWPKDQEIDVIVFSSSTPHLIQDEEIAAIRATEQERVRKILRVIDPHLGRCKSLIFDLKFTSSLPSSAPFLSLNWRLMINLRLIAQIDDGPGQVVGSVDNAKNRSRLKPLGAFQKIALSALTLIDVVGLYSTEPKEDRRKDNFSAYVSNHAFISDDKDEYSLRRFLTSLPQAFESTWRLTLHNVSISGALPGPEALAPRESRITTQRLTLYSLCDEFMAQFYSEIEVATMRTDIINCKIPPIQQTIRGTLHLDSIPSSDESDDRSLQNVLATWQGFFLEVKSCHSFNDLLLSELFSSLSSSGTASKLAPELRTLRIRDCTNFSPSAMRQFLQSRSDMNVPLGRLNVAGRCPRLSTEDREWFLQQETVVDWADDE